MDLTAAYSFRMDWIVSFAAVAIRQVTG